MVHGTCKRCNQTRRSVTEKKILATVLLWYMGLRKKLSWHSIPTEKKYTFPLPATLLLWFMGLEKINLTGSSMKILYFRFYLQYFCGVQDLRTFWIGTRSHPKKIVSSYSTRRTRNLGKNFHRYSTTTEKKLLVTTVLLWCTGYRNYCSVLC